MRILLLYWIIQCELLDAPSTEGTASPIGEMYGKFARTVWEDIANEKHII